MSASTTTIDTCKTMIARRRAAIARQAAMPPWARQHADHSRVHDGEATIVRWNRRCWYWHSLSCPTTKVPNSWGSDSCASWGVVNGEWCIYRMAVGMGAPADHYRIDYPTGRRPGMLRPLLVKRHHG